MTVLKSMFRHLLKHKFHALNNILGLAIGLACAIIIMLWVRHETSFDRFHQDLDRLYRVCFYTDTNNSENKVYYNYYMPGGLTDILKERYPEINRASIYVPANAGLSYNEKTVSGNGNMVHPDFIEMFSFQFLAGDRATALSAPNNLVLTKSIAIRLFANESPLGKSILLDNAVPLTVTGVVADPPRNSTVQFDYLISYAMAPPFVKSTKVKCGEMFVMLDNVNDMQAVSAKIEPVYNDLNPNEYPNYLYLQPFSKIHLFALEGNGGRITYVYIFAILAIFVLGMACINFINLSTARASIRSKEIAVKKVIGAGRRQLIFQFLLESFVYCIVAMSIAVLLVKLTLPSINTLLGEQLEFLVSREWLPLFIITLFTGLAAGSYPALFMSGLVPVNILKGNASNHIYSRPSAVRKLLITVQFTLSTFFLICITVIYAQLNYFQNKPLGFDHKNVVHVPLQQTDIGKSETIKTELEQNPNIQDVSVTQFLMTRLQADAGLSWPGKPQDAKVFTTGMNRVNSDYLNTFNLEMVQGRFFSSEHPSDLTDACVVNEEAVKAMEISDPIGVQITWGEGSGMDMTGTIIGVVKNHHTQSLHNPIRPFVLFNTNHGSHLYIKIKSGQTRQALQAIEATMSDIVPNTPFSYTFLDDALYRHYQIEVFTKTIILYITILAVIITLMGLLGLAAFNAERRTKEIGVRKILGASVSSIIAELSKEFLWLGIIAMLIASPIAWYAMHQWLQNFAYRIGIHPWMFLLAGVSLFTIALLTLSIRSLSAALANPVKSLKYE